MSLYFLRNVKQSDFEKLSRSLRAADRAELAASHPRRKTADLLRQFVRASVISRSFVCHNRVAAMGGITPDGCVWLLTGKQVEKCPKAFLKTIRIFLQKRRQQNPFLYNWVDARYQAALHFIVHLGGEFSGEYIQFGKQKFLFFTFRRCSMGGIVNAGKTYVSTASQAFKTRKQQVRYYTDKLAQTAAEKEALLAEDKARQSYLFRSAAERQRELYDQARHSAATWQSKAAKNGVTASSQTAQLVQDKARLQADRQTQQVQAQTQEEVSQQNRRTAERLNQLKKQEGLYRKMRNIKSSLWKLGKQLFS